MIVGGNVIIPFDGQAYMIVMLVSMAIVAFATIVFCNSG